MSDTSVAERPVGCECLERINTLLFEDGSNTVVGDSCLLDMKTGQTRTVVEIATYKRDSRKREKKVGMTPTFCPFCGKRYPTFDDNAPPTDEAAQAADGGA